MNFNKLVILVFIGLFSLTALAGKKDPDLSFLPEEYRDFFEREQPRLEDMKKLVLCPQSFEDKNTDYILDIFPTDVEDQVLRFAISLSREITQKKYQDEDAVLLALQRLMLARSFHIGFLVNSEFNSEFSYAFNSFINYVDYYYQIKMLSKEKPRFSSFIFEQFLDEKKTREIVLGLGNVVYQKIEEVFKEKQDIDLMEKLLDLFGKHQLFQTELGMLSLFEMPRSIDTDLQLLAGKFLSLRYKYLSKTRYFEDIKLGITILSYRFINDSLVGNLEELFSYFLEAYKNSDYYKRRGIFHFEFILGNLSVDYFDETDKGRRVNNGRRRNFSAEKTAAKAKTDLIQSTFKSMSEVEASLNEVKVSLQGFHDSDGFNRLSKRQKNTVEKRLKKLNDASEKINDLKENLIRSYSQAVRSDCVSFRDNVRRMITETKDLLSRLQANVRLKTGDGGESSRLPSVITDEMRLKEKKERG